MVFTIVIGAIRLFTDISDSPKLHSAGFSNELSLGEDAVATCAVKKGASGPFALSWHREGHEMANTGRIAVLTKASRTMLTIEAIRAEDIDNYTCVAKNAIGSDALTLPLLVTGEALRTFLSTQPKKRFIFCPSSFVDSETTL